MAKKNILDELEKRVLKVRKEVRKKAGSKDSKTEPKIRAVLKRINHNMVIETGVDRLLQLVDKKKTIKMATAARTLGFPKERVEEWCKILEDHKLIDMHYPPLGEPVLKSKKGAENEG